jgi:hypothetical protein
MRIDASLVAMNCRMSMTVRASHCSVACPTWGRCSAALRTVDSLICPAVSAADLSDASSPADESLSCCFPHACRRWHAPSSKKCCAGLLRFSFHSFLA